MSRAKQRENRRKKAWAIKNGEDPLDRRDYCGIKDLTPYQAVKNIIRAEAGLPRQYPVMG